MPNNVLNLVEAALFVAQKPLTIKTLQQTILAEKNFSSLEVKAILDQLAVRYHDSGVELCEIKRGFEFRARQQYSNDLAKLWPQRKTKLSKAVLETLTIIAYRGPITRAEIEAIRGVAVASSVIQALLDKQWLVKAGEKEIPGKPTLWKTSSVFLDDFGLKSLQELPTLDADLLAKLDKDFQT
ncbi:SMC-Scp complex subunit ScpB [Alginatibacterium sediminis]|uniref:SMC-Scp complex subunit ScpB n=1 Tax=Alginatibacterium sediminis TaxID=2164068 RepID=A0A420EIK6_9ALTE|nr:SMC-Scp complex subunit ScpB [Alginatibacterium sediminis]RKF20396.1 SMC-Scp complex subunit ScpB [Alginatibacterium sediminis]